MQKIILVIDNTEQKLLEITGALRRAQYLVHYVNDIKQAMEELSNVKIDISISYIEPSDTETIKFLKDLEHQGTVVRIAIAEYSEDKKLDQLIIDNTAKVFMYKPWDTEEIIDVVERIFYYQEAFGNGKLLSVIKKAKQLPTLPEIYYDILKMAEEQRGMPEISKRIEADLSISARVLRIANSAFYGAKTGSVLQAIMFLGTNSMMSIILSTTFFKNKSRLYDVDRLWEHSELTNRIINHLYYYKHGKNMPSTYSSIGLLHNIGKLILLTYFSDEYQAVVDLIKKQPDNDLSSAEKLILGYTNPQIGAYLLDYWDLPESISQGILFYLDPQSAPEQFVKIAAFVHMASYIAWSILSADNLSFRFNTEVLSILDISQAEMDNFIEQHKAIRSK